MLSVRASDVVAFTRALDAHLQADEPRPLRSPKGAARRPPRGRP